MKNIYSRFTGRRTGMVVLSLLLFASCRRQDVPAPPDVSPAAALSADVARDWMEQLRQAVRQERMNPPQASRVYAYAAIALYEAVRPGIAGSRSLSGQVPLLEAMPVPGAPEVLSYEAAANEALHQVALGLFASASARAGFDSLFAAWELRLSQNADAARMRDARLFGREVARLVSRRAAADGYEQTRSMVYQVPDRSTNPSFWAPTGAQLQPLEPYWGRVRCFAMATASECEQPPAIAFSTDTSSAFYREAMEVYQVAQQLNDEQKAIARWWADGANTPTPPGHWVAIANDLVAQRGIRLGRAAELYALLNMALADAFISCWDAKYKYNLLRPQTYIRDYIPGGSGFSSLISTPPFPEYPSGHSVSSGAAAEVLTELLGEQAFTDRTNTEMGLSARTFPSFRAAAEEAALSRLYGGIHYRQGNEFGVRQGKEVARVIFRKVRLR